jgi:hypothetical protein
MAATIFSLHCPPLKCYLERIAIPHVSIAPTSMETRDMSIHDHIQDPDYQLAGRSGKSFIPGQSGNPTGRPKKPTLKETIERILQEELPGKGMTKLEAVAHIWISEAMIKRDPRALNALINRLYPTPRLRPVEPDSDAPQFEVKLIEFVTYREGVGQDHYREISDDELYMQGDEFKASNRYRDELIRQQQAQEEHPPPIDDPSPSNEPSHPDAPDTT